MITRLYLLLLSIIRLFFLLYFTIQLIQLILHLSLIN